MKYIVARLVTTDECPWLPEAVKPGTVVYDYTGATYGAINRVMGTPISFVEGEGPFYEMPYTALKTEDGFQVQSPYIAVADFS